MTIITTAEAAKFLGINERSVRKAADRGHLRCSWGDTGHGVRGRIFTCEGLTAYAARKRALFGVAPADTTGCEPEEMLVF